MRTKKCPYCQNVIDHIEAEEVTAKGPNNEPYNGAVFLCPECSTILTATIDPVFLTNQVLKELRKNRGNL